MATSPNPALPIVSLDGPDHLVAQHIHEACTDYGFLYVSNHGIPSAVTDNMFSAIQAFFALPLEAKLGIVADANNRGYTAIREETLDPAHQSTGDTKEGLYFGREIAPDSPEAATPLHGPNQWPDEVLFFCMYFTCAFLQLCFVTTVCVCTLAVV